MKAFAIADEDDLIGTVSVEELELIEFSLRYYGLRSRSREKYEKARGLANRITKLLLEVERV